MTTGTADSATTVRQFLEAILAGDVETAMSYLDDDAEMNTAEHHPFLSDQYRGRQGFLDLMPKIADELDGFRIDIVRILGCGDVAVSQVRYQGVVKKTGRSVDVPAVLVWDVRDGRLIRNQEYMDTWAFRNAFESDGS
jgi:ketosteroid isomerase-like protein